MESRLPLNNLIAAIRSLESEVYHPDNGFTNEQKTLIIDRIDRMWKAFGLIEKHRQDLQDKAFALSNAISNTSEILDSY